MTLLRSLPPDIGGSQQQCLGPKVSNPGCSAWGIAGLISNLKRRAVSVLAGSAVGVALLSAPTAAVSVPIPSPLAVTKAVEPTALHPGETGKYTITVTYNGAGTAANVMLSDLVPAGLIVTETIPPATGSGTLSWTLGNMASGETKQVEVAFVVTTEAVPKGEIKATLMNAATATSTDPVLEGISETVLLDITYATGPFIMCPDDVLITEGCPTEFPKETYGMATAIDPCDPAPVVTYEDSPMVGDAPGCKEFTRTWTAKNKSGCFSICVQKFKVESALPPVITEVPPGKDLGCNPPDTAFPLCDDLAKLVKTTADTCGGAIKVNCSSATTGDDCNKTLTYTFKAVNACGIESVPKTVVYTYKIDRTPPTFKCPEGIYLGCNPDPASIPTKESVEAMVRQTATDNCGGPITVTVTQRADTSVGCMKVRVFEVIVSDSCKNDCTMCLVSYSWKDDVVSPKINNCPTGTALGCNPQSIPTCDTVLANVTVTDNCDAVVKPTCTMVDREDGCTRIRTITINAIDSCGNPAIPCVVRYTWTVDTTDPVIVCPTAPIELGCNPTLPTCADAQGRVRVQDEDCGGDVVLSCEPGAIREDGCVRTQIFKITAKNSCNRTSTCDVSYKWTVDTTDPVIVCPTATIDLGCNPTVPTCTDAQGRVRVQDEDCGGEVVLSCEPGTIVENGCVRTQVFKITAKNRCNRTSTCNVTYRWIVDTTDPVIVCPTTPIDLGCNPTLPTIADSRSRVTVRDEDCGGEVVITSEPGPVLQDGCIRTQLFKITAKNSCNRTSTCNVSYKWTVDTTDPVIVCPTATIDLGCNPTLPTCTDAQARVRVEAEDCGGEVVLSCAPGTIVQDGCIRTQMFTITAKNKCNRTSTCNVSYKWTVDQDPPVLQGVPADAEVACGGTIPPPANVTATDNCVGAIVPTFVETATKPDCTGYYEITRTWTAIDRCQKTATDSQLIKVKGCPAQISGFVYEDANDDGIKDVGEVPIANVTLTLTGKDCEGNAVNTVKVTDALGAYSFPNLKPSDASGYKCTETHPLGYLDGKDAKAGVVIAGSNLTDFIETIVLVAGDNSINNNFGELVSCDLEITKTCDPCEVTELLPADCTTLGKPFTITFTYTGGGCAASNNDQSADTCMGSVDPTKPVIITAPDNEDYLFTKDPMVPGTPSLELNIGDMFTVSAPGSPSGKIDPNSLFVLTNSGGEEVIGLHTSCSQPMGVDDVFGSLTIYAMNGYTGKTTIKYTYQVKNNGGAVTGVNIVDDKLGHIAGPFDLAAGATSDPYMKSTLISETTTNKATVTGTLVNGTICEDEMEITVTVNRKKCCLLVMDSDALDSGLNSVQQAAAALSVDPAFLVNEDQATETDNPPLRWNELKPGDIVTIPAGVLGDEGIFALPANTSFSTEAFEAGTVPQSELSTVTGLMPLRNHDIHKMVGMRFVAVVYDKDIAVDYRPVAGCLQGERTGTFSFTVLNVLVPGNLPESSSSTSMYELVVRVEEPAQAEVVHHVKVQDKEPDKVQITKATYNSTNGTLSVFATSSFGSQSLMTVSVDGYITEAPMKYQSTTKRYEYVMPYPANLSGMKVMISTNKGGTHNTLIK